MYKHSCGILLSSPIVYDYLLRKEHLSILYTTFLSKRKSFNSSDIEILQWCLTTGTESFDPVAFKQFKIIYNF